MKLSKLFIRTVRDVPGEVKSVSHNLLIKGSYIRKVSPGLYSYLPLGCLVLKKIECFLRKKMEDNDFQEIIFPALLSREAVTLPEELEQDLFNIYDRRKRNYVLGLNYGEALIELIGKEVRNYKELPLYFYQLDRGFRDEYKPKGGLVKAREFFVKNSYSFHASLKDLEINYEKMFRIYKSIFEQIGIEPVIIEADTVGFTSHKFLIENDYGYESFVFCHSCGYKKSLEKTELFTPDKDLKEEEVPQMKSVLTPGKATIEDVTQFMQEKASSFIKTIIYKADDKPLVALVRGDREINNYKLKRLLGVGELELADEKLVEEVTGAPVGFAGPAGLSGVRIIADNEVQYMNSAITGANQVNRHVRNVKTGRDFIVNKYGDIRMASSKDLCKSCRNPLEVKKGILLGHLIKQEDKYSHKVKAVFYDKEDNEKYFYTGYYSFFISQAMAAVIEANNDEQGIIWPLPFSPFEVIILLLNPADEEQKSLAFLLYEKLKSENIDVLIDDRTVKVGVKFKEADLLGIPLRITVGSRTIKEKAADCFFRKTGEKFKVSLEELVCNIKNRIEEEYEKSKS